MTKANTKWRKMTKKCLLHFFIIMSKNERLFREFRLMLCLNILFLKSMKFFYLFYLVLCLLFAGCTHPAKNVESSDILVEDSGIQEIAVIENISKSQKMYLSTIASNIEYCMLETDKKCLVTPSMSIYCSNEYIVTIGIQSVNHEVCYVFNRKTGKFVRQISRMGQGPNEFLETIDSFWDTENEQVCVWSHPYYIFYNIDGTISHKINRNEHRFFSRGAISFNDYYVKYVPNSSGNETKRIVFLDRNGVVIDSISNFRTWEKTQRAYAGSHLGSFHVYGNELYYADIYCDTLYHIQDFNLQPRYVFNTGGHTLPYQVHDGAGRYNIMEILKSNELVDHWKEYFVLDKMFEDARHLYFTFDYRTKRYPAIYNKKEEILQILPPVIITLPSKYSKMLLYGFENDLDGGLPFWPRQMISENEMMCVYTAEELLELDISKITHEKLKNVLNYLKEDSNPVVAIVTLKD